ncbi:MAG: M23 family metallopeptidase [Planctomycetota bacterium]|nr:M23 family metallopeptidase [Planctomycetota bacterium]
MDADATKFERPEGWVIASWVVVAAEFALAVYLGLKRPGVGPVKAYIYGPFVLAACAFVVGLYGLFRSIRRPPFGSTQRLVAFGLLAIVIGSASYGLPFPAARSARPTSARIRVPAQGPWKVAWGGIDDTSAIWRTRPDRSFAYVLVIERDGKTRANESDPASAFARGAEVVAPAAGTVVRVVDGVPDDGQLHADDLGNHVVIEIAPGEFLFVSGLEKGSLVAKVGDVVQQGAPLGRVGYSAWSPLCPEPCLGLHVQDTPDPFWGQGIPFYFFDAAIDGERIVRGSPVGRGWFSSRALGGQVIEHRP